MMALLALPARATDGYVWPDAPSAVLREELFGIRLRLLLQDKGPKHAAKFLRDALSKGPSSEVYAYVGWISLWPQEWGIEPLLERDTALVLLRVAHREGSAIAADVLGRVEIGKGDLQEGLTLLDLAVERGSPDALGLRGVMRAQGRGLTVDVERGMTEVQRAAALGSTAGMVDLAAAFASGAIDGEPNPTMALDYYYRLAIENRAIGWRILDEEVAKGTALAGRLRSLAVVRFANEGGAMSPSVVRQHITALERDAWNEPRAWVELGVMHLSGVKFIRRDDKRARALFTSAVEFGNPEARFFLAYMQVRGLGVSAEPEEGLREMTALAEAGNERAAARLGYLYYWGTTEAGRMPKDPAKAFYYSRMAAERGSKIAVMNLAYCYKHGIGTKENPALAAKLYWLAYRAGVHGAKEEVLRHLAFARVP